jgi:hypothetical protein
VLNQNLISSLHKSNYDEAAIIMGSAPSLKVMNNYKDLDGTRIGIGDVPWRTPEFGPFNFWVAANPYYPLPWHPVHMKHIRNAKTNFLLSSAAFGNVKFDGWLNISNKISKLSKNNSFTFYDQRHFDRNLCSTQNACCKFYKEFISDLTIQELLGKEIGSKGPAYSQGDTVALHALALAILLRKSPIYLIGIEIPLTFKNYYHYKDYKMWGEGVTGYIKRQVKRRVKHYANQFPAASHSPIRIFQDFQKIIKIALDLEIEIISLSSTSPLNFIEGVKFISVNPRR